MFFKKQKHNAVDALLEEKMELMEENKKLKEQCRNLQENIQLQNEEINKLSSKNTKYL